MDGLLHQHMVLPKGNNPSRHHSWQPESCNMEGTSGTISGQLRHRQSFQKPTDCTYPYLHAKTKQLTYTKVFDTNFCGDWAGNVWSTSATCASLGPSCQNYVENNPAAFANFYWEINSLQVYQAAGPVQALAHSAAIEDKNHTLPLLTTPLAMGGGLPPSGQKKMQ